MGTPDTRSARKGTQALERGLQLLEAVASGITDLESLSRTLETSRSTTHRLASTLVRMRFLSHAARQGYSIGPRVIELGFHAHSELHLPSIAQPYLAELARVTRETVHLGVLDGSEVIYIDKVAGSREVQMASRIGHRMPAQTTSLGKVLLAGLPPSERSDRIIPGLKRTPSTIDSVEALEEELRRVSVQGYALDLEENEMNIRCIAAPIRDASGDVVAAVSIASIVVYMSDERLASLIPAVQDAARSISRALGWRHA